MKWVMLLFICCWEVVMPLWYAGKCGEKRKLRWLGAGAWHICVWVWFGLTYYQRLLIFYSRAFLILEIIVVMLLAVWRFHIKWSKAFLMLSTLYGSIHLLDLLMLMVKGYVYGIDAMWKVQEGINYQALAFYLASRFLVTSGFYFLHKKQREFLLLYEKRWKILFSVPIIQYLSVHVGGYFFYHNEKIIALRSIFILFFTSMCITFFLCIQYIWEKGTYEKKILEERASAAELKYRERQRDERERNILVHDIQNHLVVLNGILRNDEMGRALDYVEKIQENYRAIKQSPETGNIVVDTILGSKADRAGEAGIGMNILSDNLSTIRTGAVSLQICWIMQSKPVPEWKGNGGFVFG